MNKDSRILKLICLILIIISLLFGAVTSWIYFGEINAAKIKILKILPYPVALVNGRPILMKSFLRRLELSQAFEKKQNYNDTLTELEKNVLHRMIAEEESMQLAEEKHLGINEQELQSEFNNIENEYNKKHSEPLSSALSGFGTSPEEFKKDILKPNIISAKLATWHNEQEALNTEAYAEADKIRLKLKNGETFEKLVAAYSQDPAGKQVEGDSGFVESVNLLAEIRSGLKDASEGEVRLIATRDGLLLIKLEEKTNSPLANSQRLHLREIFIKTSDFNSWLEQETSNASIKTYFNFKY